MSAINALFLFKYYKAIIKDGCDGSGRHSLYSQKNNVETHAIVSLMFVPLEMYEKKINPFRGNADPEHHMEG